MQVDSDEEDRTADEASRQYTGIRLKAGRRAAIWCQATRDLLPEGTCTAFVHSKVFARPSCAASRAATNKRRRDPDFAHDETHDETPDETPVVRKTARTLKTQPYYLYDTEEQGGFNDVVHAITPAASFTPPPAWRRSVDALTRILRFRRMSTYECEWMHTAMRNEDYTLRDLSRGLLSICRSVRSHTRCDVVAIDTFVQLTIPSLWETEMKAYEAWRESCDAVHAEAVALSVSVMERSKQLGTDAASVYHKVYPDVRVGSDELQAWCDGLDPATTFLDANGQAFPLAKHRKFHTAYERIAYLAHCKALSTASLMGDDALEPDGDLEERFAVCIQRDLIDQVFFEMYALLLQNGELCNSLASVHQTADADRFFADAARVAALDESGTLPHELAKLKRRFEDRRDRLFQIYAKTVRSYNAMHEYLQKSKGAVHTYEQTQSLYAEHKGVLYRTLTHEEVSRIHTSFLRAEKKDRKKYAAMVKVVRSSLSDNRLDLGSLPNDVLHQLLHMTRV